MQSVINNSVVVKQVVRQPWNGLTNTTAILRATEIVREYNDTCGEIAIIDTWILDRRTEVSVKEKDRIRCNAAVVYAAIRLPASELISSFSPAMTPFLCPAGGAVFPAVFFALSAHDYFLEIPNHESYYTEFGSIMRSIVADVSIA